MTDPLDQARKAQASARLNALAKLQVERETLARLAICLVRMIDGNLEVARAEDRLVISDEDMKDAPTLFALDMRPMELKEKRELKEGETEVPMERMWVVTLTSREQGAGGNGTLLVPGGPRIVAP